MRSVAPQVKALVAVALVAMLGLALFAGLLLGPAVGLVVAAQIPFHVMCWVGVAHAT